MKPPRVKTISGYAGKGDSPSHTRIYPDIELCRFQQARAVAKPVTGAAIAGWWT